jgi:hypothetical protein
MNYPDATDFALKNYGLTPVMFSTEEWMQNVEFLVPLYQRLFVWEEEQIDQFLEDLWDAYNKDKNSPYYIGILTVYQTSNKSTTWELVDGQQRITVLNLLGMACSHKWTDNSIWEKFIHKNDGQESRLQYFARKNDQDDLHKLEKCFEKASINNTNMKRFIDVFNRFVSRNSNSDNESFFPKNGQDFSRYVYEQTTALIAFLPDSYEINALNLYFEKMNAAGRQLEAHEIIKGKYFGKHSTTWNAISDGSKRFVEPKDKTVDDYDDSRLITLLENKDNNNYQQEPALEDSFPMQDSTHLVMSFPIFLLHVLSNCIGKGHLEIVGFWDTKHLLTTFKQAEIKWKKFGTKTFDDAFMEAMADYRKWMDINIIHIDDNHPTPPYQHVDSEITVESAYTKPVWQFQSMLYVSGGEPQKWVLDAYQICLERSPLDNDDFLVNLKRQDYQRHSLIDTKFLYDCIDRYWFWRLDYILWEKVFNEEKIGLLDNNKAQLDAVKDYTFKRNRSIEHLHPQTSDNPWEKSDLNSFGNLAMISTSFNSQQSNDSVGTKFGRMLDKIAKKDIESIKLLLMFNTAEGKDDKWTIEKSEEHRCNMMELLMNDYAAINH